MLIHVHRGKEAKDRFFPLPHETLEMLREQDGFWKASRVDFIPPVKAISKIYQTKFRDLMIKKGLFSQIPAEVWRKGWNVNVQAVGDAERTIRYLSRYVFQVAISNHRIVAEGRRVIFRYPKPGSVRDRHIVVDAMEFIRRFLQHVLPTGFMKVRYYGFLKTNSAVDLEAARLAIQLCHGFEAKTPDRADCQRSSVNKGRSFFQRD